MKLLDKINMILDESVNDKYILKLIIMIGSAGCFDKNTLIKTTNGYKKISEVVSGDNVYTIDDNNKIIYEEVIRTFSYTPPKKMIKITLENGENFICTPDHKIRTKSGDWVQAKDLSINEEL
jgi:intein/homing endonuclease